jgi:hypothetical protein
VACARLNVPRRYVRQSGTPAGIRDPAASYCAASR